MMMMMMTWRLMLVSAKIKLCAVDVYFQVGRFIIAHVYEKAGWANLRT